MADKIEGLGRAQLMAMALGAHLHVGPGVGHLCPQNDLPGLSHFHMISCDFHILFL